jgi:hypothetical protein
MMGIGGVVLFQLGNVTNLTSNGFPGVAGWIPPVCLG